MDKSQIRIYELARVIYLARVKSCYGRDGMEYASNGTKNMTREQIRSVFLSIYVWPAVDTPEFRKAIHDEASIEIEICRDQAKAALKFFEG